MPSIVETAAVLSRVLNAEETAKTQMRYVGLIVMNHFFTVFFIIEAVTKIVISPKRYL